MGNNNYLRRVFLISIVIVLFGAGCGRSPESYVVSPEKGADDDAVEVTLGTDEGEGCENLGLRFDPQTGQVIVNRTIPSGFPTDAPRAPDDFRVGDAQCNKLAQNKGTQYVVVWYGKRDTPNRLQTLLNEYLAQAQAQGWEITNPPAGSSKSFSAQKNGGKKKLYFSLTGGFINEEDKDKIFPGANINFHVDVKEYR